MWFSFSFFDFNLLTMLFFLGTLLAWKIYCSGSSSICLIYKSTTEHCHAYSTFLQNTVKSFSANTPLLYRYLSVPMFILNSPMWQHMEAFIHHILCNLSTKRCDEKSYMLCREANVIYYAYRRHSFSANSPLNFLSEIFLTYLCPILMQKRGKH